MTTATRWRCESRDKERYPGQPDKGVEQTWWLTDGRESFRMMSMTIGDILASYLNQKVEL